MITMLLSKHYFKIRGIDTDRSLTMCRNITWIIKLNYGHVDEHSCWYPNDNWRANPNLTKKDAKWLLSLYFIPSAAAASRTTTKCFTSRPTNSTKYQTKAYQYSFKSAPHNSFSATDPCRATTWSLTFGGRRRRPSLFLSIFQLGSPLHPLLSIISDDHALSNVVTSSRMMNLQASPPPLQHTILLQCRWVVRKRISSPTTYHRSLPSRRPCSLLTRTLSRP